LGINCDTFRTLIEYIYTGEATSLASADCLALIETANRLCLPHLVSLAEAFVVSEMQALDKKGVDFVEDAIMFLEPAEVFFSCSFHSYTLKLLGANEKIVTL
jgi:Rho-related BTB domain-containing protein 1/2